MQDQILDMLLKEDEITWQTILRDLIKTNEMDPWNIDISVLSNEYLKTVKSMKKMNFFVSGKIVLAASFLLNIKSKRLLTEHIENFDNILYHSDEEDFEGDYLESAEDFEDHDYLEPRLTIKTPQARKRKVSLNDLVNALESAIEVDQRRKTKKLKIDSIPDTFKLPDRNVDISHQIKGLYQTIISYFSNKDKEKLTFSNLIPSESKSDKIMTFVPLLHLENQKKVNMNQKDDFGEIEIFLKNKLN
ncbi:segregation/condensation protein A [archaeon]|jgi:segregation and condensation protein A|nr:segregation/condensation protein A [archaeon]